MTSDQKSLNSSRNPKFTKCILMKGDCDKQIKEGQWFTIKIKKLFDSSILLNTKLNHDPNDLIGIKFPHGISQDYETFRLRLGFFRSQIARVLHRAISQMTLNEIAQISFELDPNMLDESFKFSPKEAKNEERIYLDIKFEVKLVEIESANDQFIYNLSLNQLYALALDHKNEANDLHSKLKFFRTSFNRYHKAISYVIIAEQKESSQTIQEEGNEVQDYDIKTKLPALKSQLYSNIAACQLKSQNYKMCIKNCDKCLKLDPNNTKLLFRRGQALIGLNEFEKAIEDLQQAIKQDPENKEILQKMSEAEQLKKDYNHKMASLYKKMFS